MKLIIIALLFIIICGCEEKIFTGSVECSKCYSVKPDSADIAVSLTYNDTYDTIPLVVYRDEVNDNNIEYIDTAYGGTYYLYSPVNQKYAVKVEYAGASKTTYVIDATKLTRKRVSDACDETCWIIEGGEIDARLKFE